MCIRDRAKGEAEAMKLKNSEVSEEIIQLEFINKWDGKMPQYYGGDGTMFGIKMPDGDTASSGKPE